MSNLVKNIFYLVTEKFATTFILLLSNVIVIRYLGVEDFGKLAIFQLYYLLAVTVSEFGIRRVYSSLKSPSREALIFNQAFNIKLASSLFFFIVAFLYLYISNYDIKFYALLLAFVASPFEIFTYHFEANLKNATLVKIRVTVSLLMALLRIFLCFVGENNLIYIMLTYAFSNLIINLLCVFATRKHKMKITRVRSRLYRSVIRKHLFSRSLFFWISVVIVQLNMRTDQFMLSLLAGTASVGIYAGAYKLVEQLLTIPSLLAGVFLPYISKSQSLDKEKYLENLYLYGLLASIPISLLLAFSAPWLIPFLLGKEFSASVPVFAVLMLSLPVLVIVNLSGLYYSIFKLERFAIIRNAFGLLLSIFLNYFFIKSYGATGAAFSVIISYSCVAFIIEWVTPQTRKNANIKLKVLIDLLKLNTYQELIFNVKAKIFKK